MGGRHSPPLLAARFGPAFEEADANQRRQLALSLGLVLLVPAVLILRVVRGDGLDLPVVLLGSGLLPLLVIVQLFRHPVAVNLSARQFAPNRAEDLIASVLGRTGLDPRLLEVEITESVFMGGVQATSESLSRLRSLGVRCSIDDFGTGYSALHYLARMPVDTLKIDRSFVSRIGIDPSEEAIVEAIIALAHSLRMNVIAEGVETEAQARFLRLRGCHQMQGYLFSPALPAEKLQRFLARHQPSEPVAAVPGSRLADILHAVCGDGDIDGPDRAAVSELLEALQARRSA